MVVDSAPLTLWLVERSAEYDSAEVTEVWSVVGYSVGGGKCVAYEDSVVCGVACE